MSDPYRAALTAARARLYAAWDVLDVVCGEATQQALVAMVGNAEQGGLRRPFDPVEAGSYAGVSVEALAVAWGVLARFMVNEDFPAVDSTMDALLAHIQKKRQPGEKQIRCPAGHVVAVIGKGGVSVAIPSPGHHARVPGVRADTTVVTWRRGRRGEKVACPECGVRVTI